MDGFGLAQAKPEGGFSVIDRSHELSGRKFEAMKDCYQRYSGPAIVVRQLKGGMMLCIDKDGNQFKECLRKIKRTLK